MFAGGSMSAYQDILVPRLFVPWADLLLDRLGVVPGQSVVDIACGPGTVSRLAAARVGPQGRVVGCDLSPAMLEIARDLPPVPGGMNLEFRLAPAEALGLPAGLADVVTCQQGLQFFRDRSGALREARRVARPGARVGYAVWAAIDDCPPFAAIAAGIESVLGAESAELYRSGPWGMTDPDELSGLFDRSGFTDVTVEHLELPLVFDGGPRQLVASLAVSAMAPQLAATDEDTKDRLLAAIARAAAPLLVDGEIRSYAASHIVLATA